jgi:hypothetical protein
MATVEKAKTVTDILDNLFKDVSSKYQEGPSQYLTLDEIIEMTQKDRAYIPFNGKWVRMKLKMVRGKVQVMLSED